MSRKRVIFFSNLEVENGTFQFFWDKLSKKDSFISFLDNLFEIKYQICTS